MIFNSDTSKLVDVTLDKDGLLYQTSLAKASYSWKALSEVRETEKHIFLCLHRGSVVCIPRTAISNIDIGKMMTEVRQLIQEKK
ncbi:MAG: YcxB family protein [Spirochaetia bacterium]